MPFRSRVSTAPLVRSPCHFPIPANVCDHTRNNSIRATRHVEYKSMAKATMDHKSVIETDVEIHTPDGVCDAAFIHPAAGSHPGILVWADALGLRPALRDMGKRLASHGYSVLAPNPFYRSAKAPVFDASFSFQNPAHMARFQQLRAPLSEPGAAERDAAAYLAFLDAQEQVDP